MILSTHHPKRLEPINDDGTPIVGVPDYGGLLVLEIDARASVRFTLFSNHFLSLSLLEPQVGHFRMDSSFSW